MKRFVLSIVAALCTIAALAQTPTVKWSYTVEKATEDSYRVLFTANIARGFHSYSTKDEYSPTEILDAEVKGGSLIGSLQEIGTPKDIDGSLAYEGSMQIAQNIRLTSDTAVYSGTIFSNACNVGNCKPEYYDFEIRTNELKIRQMVSGSANDSKSLYPCNFSILDLAEISKINMSGTVQTASNTNVLYVNKLDAAGAQE